MYDFHQMQSLTLAAARVDDEIRGRKEPEETEDDNSELREYCERMEISYLEQSRLFESTGDHEKAERMAKLSRYCRSLIIRMST